MTFETDDNVDTGATENTAAEVETEQTETASEAETQEPETQEAEEAEEEKPKRNRAKERIEQLARENAELKQWRAQQEAKANTPEVTSEPQLEDYDDYNEWQKAFHAHQRAEVKREILADLKGEEVQKTQVQKQAEFVAILSTAADEHPDFDNVVQAGLSRNLPMPLTLDEVANEFGYSADIQVKLLYALGKDPELHERVSESSKLKAGRILSELVDSWGSKPKPQVSKAPPPIKPVQANAPASRSTDSLSDEEFLAQRRKNRLKG